MENVLLIDIFFVFYNTHMFACNYLTKIHTDNQWYKRKAFELYGCNYARELRIMVRLEDALARYSMITP